MGPMETEATRLEMAWFIYGHNPKSEFNINYQNETINNRIEDAAAPWPKEFFFADLTGWVVDGNYVCWGGMGCNLEDVGGYEFRKAIKEQTGY